MRRFRKSTVCISMLLPLIQQHPEIQIRQLAGVVLKKNIVNLFEKISKEDQNHVKATLLDCYFKEKSNIVQKSIGALIGAVATVALEDKQWPELMQVIG